MVDAPSLTPSDEQPLRVMPPSASGEPMSVSVKPDTQKGLQPGAASDLKEGWTNIKQVAKKTAGAMTRTLGWLWRKASGIVAWSWRRARGVLKAALVFAGIGGAFGFVRGFFGYTGDQSLHLFYEKGSFATDWTAQKVKSNLPEGNMRKVVSATEAAGNIFVVIPSSVGAYIGGSAVDVFRPVARAVTNSSPAAVEPSRPAKSHAPSKKKPQFNNN